MGRKPYGLAVVVLATGLAAAVETVDPIIPPVEPATPGPGPARAMLVEANALMRAGLGRSTYNVNGSGLACAVLDTGARTSHNDFAGGKIIAGRNFTDEDGGDPDIYTDPTSGHGTNVAGIVAANGVHTGIAPGANLVILKVLRSATGGGTFAWAESALDWIIANHSTYNITAANLSLGSNNNFTTMPNEGTLTIRSKIQTLRALNVAVVIAAGNGFYTFSSAEGMAYPAIVPECISVGCVFDGDYGGPWTWSSGARANTTGPDRLAPFSQRLRDLIDPTYNTDYFAPGAWSDSTGNTDDTATSSMTGTSQASPATAGVVLLLQQLYLRRAGQLPTVDQIEEWLTAGAVSVYDGDDEDDNVTNTEKSYPRIDVLAALAAIPHPARKLAFITQPTDTWVNDPITPAVQVEIQDLDGNRSEDATDAVTLAIGNNPGGATLSGTVTVNADDGVATFPGLSLNQFGEGYTLVASSGALLGATSNAFNVIRTRVISGTIRRYGNNPVSGVTLTATGGYTAVSGADGAYSLRVPDGWSGTITPSKSNIPRWSPGSRTYSNVTADQPNEDYLAQVRLSGQVQTAGGAGVADVTITLNNGGGSTTTDSDGAWQIDVPWSWPGRVTPSKTAWRFDPTSMVLPSCADDRDDIDFTATPPVTISGTVRRYGDRPMAGVTLTASPGGFVATTADDGAYTVSVPHGWSGKVTPTKSGVPRWSPAYRGYDNVTAAQTGQDYLAQVRVSGTVRTVGGAGVGGAAITLGNGGGATTTASGGAWQIDVPWSWTGRVTPKLAGYDFDPTSLVLTSRTADSPGNDFTAKPRLGISGTVRRYRDQPLAGVRVTASPGGHTATTDADGAYTLKVPDGWSGTITPSKSDVPRWSPPSRSLTNVTTAQTGQDFTAMVRLNGAVREGGAGLAGVLISLGNGRGTTTTGSNGAWQIDVPWSWAGRITPSKTGYTFTPASTVLTSCTADQAGLDFSATPPHAVTGTVRRNGDRPLAGVTLTASPGGYNGVSGADGAYQVLVPHGWSGTITPSKPDVPRWSPASRRYNNVGADQSGQDFYAQVLISGTVRSASGGGVAGVTITLNNGGGTTTTAPDGTWSCLVPWTWGGRITPSKTGYRFTPTSLVLSSCTADQPGNDFTCSESRMVLTLPTGGEVTLVFVGGAPVGGSTSRVPVVDGNRWSWSFALTPEVEGRGGGELTVFWPGLRELPPGLTLVLDDLANGRSTFLRWSAGYLCHPAPGERERPFRVTLLRETAGLAIQNLRALPARDGSLGVGFTLTRSAEVAVVLSGLNGRRIGQVPGQVRSAGPGELAWAARDEQGRPLPNGVYRIEVIATDDTGRQVRGMLMVTVR